MSGMMGLGGEGCPFQEDCEQPCPMMPDVIELSGPCEPGGYGETCGPVAGYGSLTGRYEGLEELDEEAPIVGTFTITTVPDGFPPLEIREQWVGVELPVRNSSRLERGEFEVSSADAELSLLRAGHLNAAMWFTAQGIRMEAWGPRWVFQTSDGEVNLSEGAPVSSVDFYGAPLTAELRERIEPESSEPF